MTLISEILHFSDNTLAIERLSFRSRKHNKFSTPELLNNKETKDFAYNKIQDTKNAMFTELKY